MEIQNGVDGNSNNTDQPSSSRANETEKSSNKNANQQDLKNKNGDGKTNSVPFYKLFSFADSTDVLLMIIGSIGAIGNGLSLPLMTIVFGELTDSFGVNQSNSDIVKVVSKVRPSVMLYYDLWRTPLCITTREASFH